MRGSRLPLFRRAVAESRRSLIGWTLGVAAALLLYLPLFPSLGGRDSQMAQLISTLPSGLVKSLGYQNITSGSGYVESTFYGLIGFVLMVIAAVTWGAAAIAGDEEGGTLELTIAHAVTRQRVVLERTLAIVVRLVWLALVSVVIVSALNSSAQLELRFDDLLATSAAWLGLGLLSATVSIAVGALTGRRLYATGAGAGIAVLGYVLNAIGSQSNSLSGVRAYSPYGWAFRHTPLTNGVDVPGLALLYGFSALFVVIAVVAFRSRDIRG